MEMASRSYLGSAGADACADERIFRCIVHLGADPDQRGGKGGSSEAGGRSTVPCGRISLDWKGLEGWWE